MNVNVLIKHKLVISAPILVLVIALLVVIGSTKGMGDGETPPAASPLEVEVAQVEQKDVPVYSEWS
jgi:hypothetical protein